MVSQCVKNILLCPSPIKTYYISYYVPYQLKPTEKHELELNLSIAWYEVQHVNPQWNFTAYYSA